MKPLVNKKYLLEKYAGKGGWTYARIPEVIQDKTTPFGWVKVRGTIDSVEIKSYRLMPMGNDQLFLPVKAAIRKTIGKEAGDWVHVVLYPDIEPYEVPDELMQCLEDEPKALKFFNTLSDSEKKYYTEWIFSAKKDQTKVKRLAITVNRLADGLKMYDKGQ